MWPWKNPLQLLGKTSLRALLYFWKIPFYSKRNIQQKSARKLLQLISALLKNCPAETLLYRLAETLQLKLRCWYTVAETPLLQLSCWYTATETPLLLHCCWYSAAHCPEISLALLLSFSQSAHERIWMIFSSFSSLNLTPSDFWVIPKDTFYFLIHPTLIKTHFVIYFQSHFSFLIFYWLYKSHFKIRLSNFIT